MTGKAFMLMIEPDEIKLIIDSLMLMREDDIESGWGEDNRVMTLLRRIITHGRVPYCKRIAPDAYNLCYPDGPPKIVGTYGKYNQ